jgi:hypothetical protein
MQLAGVSADAGECPFAPKEVKGAGQGQQQNQQGWIVHFKPEIYGVGYKYRSIQ